jgi:hypothetical protein
MERLEPQSESLIIGAEQLRFIRSLRAEWSWNEAGAARLTLLAPGANDASLLGRVREVTGPWLVSDEAMLVSVYRNGMMAAAVFVNHAELAPGSYEFESPFVPSRLAEQPFATSGRVQIDGGTIRMRVTPEHLSLLKNANVRLFDEGGLRCEAAVDPKRPYGEKTYFYADMGRILGLEPDVPPDERSSDAREFGEEQVRWLDDLHHTTQPALQILLRHGVLAHEVFRREPLGSGSWTPQNAS